MRQSMGGSMRSVSVTLKDRQEFCARYLSDPPHGGMVLRCQEILTEGELLELDLHLEHEDRHVSMRGLILWRRASSDGAYDVGVGFLSTEAMKREELLIGPQAADGYSERREPRYAITLKVTYETSADFIIDYTRNISTGGLFVSSRSLPDLGSDILFKLFAPGEDEAILLHGRVTWHKPGQGFGVRFVESPNTQRERL